MNILLAEQHLLCGEEVHPILRQKQVLIPLVAHAAKAVQPRGAFHG